jgi:hypothetical protein
MQIIDYRADSSERYWISPNSLRFKNISNILEIHFSEKRVQGTWKSMELRGNKIEQIETNFLMQRADSIQGRVEFMMDTVASILPASPIKSYSTNCSRFINHPHHVNTI